MKKLIIVEIIPSVLRGVLGGDLGGDLGGELGGSDGISLSGNSNWRPTGLSRGIVTEAHWTKI